jgi:hypothetical protein
MNRALLIAALGCLLAVILGVSYGFLARLRAEAPLAVDQSLSKRPAAKSTCPQAVVTQPPAGMEVSERELVPFSSTQLGMNTVISDTAAAAEPSARYRTIEVVSGGYVDELTESYDNLRPVETISVTGQRVSLLAGSLLHSTVQIVIWRQPGVVPPCDVHAVLATNLSRQQFKAVAESVQVDHSLSSTSGSASSADRNSQ